MKNIGSEIPRYELRGNGIRVHFTALQSALIKEDKEKEEGSKAPKHQSAKAHGALEDTLAFDIIKILKDNTLLIGGRSEIRRLYVKTLENLPNLISFDEDDDEEYDYNFIGLNRNENDVGSIIELNDGKLMLVLSYDIKIYGNKFKEYLNNNL